MKWIPGNSRTEQRKCIDLFWKINHEYLNPNGLSITIGDFGTLDKKTGSFQREGNIFEHPDSRDIMAAHDWNDPRNTTTIEHIFKQTKNVRRIDLPFGVGAGLTGMVDGNVTAKFQLDTERGVLLYMHGVKYSILPIVETWVRKLEEIGLFTAKGIVTETYTCSHYDLLMNNKGKRDVGVTVTASIPIPVAPAISPSVNTGFSISGDSVSGLRWQGTKNAESDSFVPMYRLKALRGGSVERGAPADKILVKDFPRPWTEIDDEGRDIFDSDSDADSDS
ncbi:uncharacterized protein BT62DRAFT_993461 [Guyanagaster necrorhizus]|uniref:Uncharacterized protein n=1 Tax=Guyanagaster necrorhizus TaxID=856835 RepID=A0A9P8ATE9_9AGAR|nr:uncharacterized protein BT62DRAFT_993461 [Guyanagaster necrorhizus MCA 3950]KAG7447125.1 hypothetical protein BT62DRAFT_993461 [Guyanagaster necrorhizus MCA 3950]